MCNFASNKAFPMPIPLFTYNRPHHTKRTIDALLRSSNVADYSLIVYSDAAKDESDANNVSAVRDILCQIVGFKSVKIVLREKNMGLAHNIISGVTETFQTYKDVIVLEDDIVVSPGFLSYMNDALAFYKDKKVWSIGAYSPIDTLNQYPYSTYTIMRNCSWGWGTWRARWEKVDWDVSDFQSFNNDRRIQRAFNLGGGNDLSPMLKRWHRGEIHSWSIRFCYAGFKNHMPTVYPASSLVSNNGADGSGSNMRPSHRYNVKTTDFIDSKLFCPDTNPVTTITLLFRRRYDLSIIRRIINLLKGLGWN